MEHSSSSSASSSPQRQGLGFRRIPPSSPSTSTASASSISDGEVPGLSNAFGGHRSRSRKRRRSPSPAAERRPGAWEAHTRGIGSKILAKQGFKGRLGRREDGISEPLQPVIRRGKVGLGADKGIEENRKRNQSWNTLDDLDAAIEAAKKHIQSKKQTPTTDNTVTGANIFSRTEQHGPKPVSEKERDKISDKLSGARRTVTLISPQLMYDLNRLRDTAISQLSTALRAKQNEEAILQNTAMEKQKAQEDLERVKTDLSQLVALENTLTGLQNMNESTYETTLKTMSDMMAGLSDNSYVKKESVTAALSELVCDTVNNKFYVCLKNSQKRGKADVRSASFISDVLKMTQEILSPDEYSKLCAVSILGPLRRFLSRSDWDVVRGACIGDVLLIIRSNISDGLVQVFAEELLLPKLVAHIKFAWRTREKHVPSHLWIHPWLPVTGRKALVEVLHHVRIGLAASLEAWKVSDPKPQRAQLIENTRKWSTVLSRKKLQLTLSRHIMPKLAVALTQIDGNSAEVPIEFRILSEWASVCSSRILASELAESFVKGPGALLRYTAFKDWKAARRMYQMWSDSFPDRLKYHFRPVLAALLFVLHAAATADDELRTRLMNADIRSLLKNRFQKVDKKKTNIERPIIPAKKARLVDVVAMVAEKESIPLIGLPDERGLKVFKFGLIRVTIDVRRGVFLVGGKIVGIDQMVNMAKS